jgi:hypothetical protein
MKSPATRLALTAAVLLSMGLGACADDGGDSADGSRPAGSTDSSSGGTGTDSSSPDGTGAAGSSVPDSGAPDGSGPGTPGSSTTSPLGPATTRPAGGTSGTTTSVLRNPPAPVTGCVDAPADTAEVTIAFDDDGLRYGAGVAPPCVRVHWSQRLTVVNSAHFSSMVSVGALTTTLAIGQSYRSEALGTTMKVGDVFDVNIVVLDAVLVVQVLP